MKNVLELCESFKDYYDFIDEWEDKLGSDGQCLIASLTFNKWLNEFICKQNIGLVIFSTEEEVQLRKGILYNYFKYPKVNLHSYSSVPHEWYKNGCNWPGHVVSKMDDFLIDWTARQFDQNAPFPLIFKLNQNE